MAYQTVSRDDVAVNLGRPLTSAEAAQADLWIATTYKLIAARFHGIGGLDQDLTDYVVTEAVSLRLRNPGGVSEMETSVDDARTVRRYSTEASAGRIVILPEWWDMLTPSGDVTGAAFTIVPG